MKKKLFLVALMVALFACLLAIGASAAGFESSYTNDVTEIGTGPDWADLSDKNATAVLKKEDGTYVRIPLYYIYQSNNSTELRHEIINAKGSAGFRYSWIGEQLGENFDHTDLVALDIPEGIKTTSGLNKYTALKEVVFPLTATGLPKSEEHPALEKVFVKQSKEADGTIKGITSIAKYAFKNVKTLAYFKLELDYTTYIGECAFMNNAVKELRFEGPMTSIESSLFGGCSKLETIYLNNTSATRVSGSQIFSSNHALKNAVLNGINLPDYTFQGANGLADGGLTIVVTNVEKIGLMAFKNMVNLSSVDISGPITSIGYSLFTGCSNLTNVKITNTNLTPATCGEGMCSGLKKLERVELKGISIGNYAFRDAGGTKGVIIECTNVGAIGDQAFAVQGGKSGNVIKVNVSGPITSIGTNIFSNNKTVESAIICVIGNPFPDVTSVGGVTSIVSKDTYDGNKDNYKTGKHIIYGYNVCELIYGGVHEESGEILYTYIDKDGNPNGIEFLSTLKVSSPCGRNCGSETIIKTIAPLFTCLGYSAPEYGNGGIAVGFAVNNTAIDEYEELTDKAVKYGVFVVLQSNLNDKDVFGEDGTAAEGVISAEITNYQFAAFELKIVGFSDEQKNTKFAMGAYVAVTDGKTTEYSYMQDDSKGTFNGKYYFASYNDALGIPSTN